jgi:pyruvate formate lyase activating enzyme
MTETDISVTGKILHLQRLSTEDGPGIRTTVFFKGCPLRCAWCHNPESLIPKRQTQWIANRCIGCGSCIAVCTVNALSKNTEGIERDRTLCEACGKCVEACPGIAMEMLGEEITVDDLVNELKKDSAYFEKSGGGVTLSGGEPCMQPVFALALMRTIRKTGLNIALDTCGLCSTETLEKLADEADHILFDVKLINTREHEQWTGAGNERILENLQLVNKCVKASQGKKKLWIRTPIIPKATDHRGNIHGIGEYLAMHLNSTTERWELCAFNNLCRDKYQRLGMEWKFANTPLLSADDLMRIETWAKDSGFDPGRIFVTGAARLENLQRD